MAVAAGGEWVKVTTGGTCMAPKLGTSMVINTPGARGVEEEEPTEIPELAEGSMASDTTNSKAGV